MSAADELHEVADGLFVWGVYDPSAKADLHSTAVVIGADLLFIDPVPLARDAMEELLGHGRPKGIVLTNGNHARAAAEYRDRFSIPVSARPEAEPELGWRPDRLLQEDEALADGLTVCTLPGGAPGELALVNDGRALHFGDAVINLPPFGFSLLPEKYCQDARLLRESLRKLLRRPAPILTLAHGLPLVTDAPARFAQLLA